MDNALFWLSAVMAIGVLGLTWALRFMRGDGRDDSPAVTSLPKDR